jgi:hypothetical protein
LKTDPKRISVLKECWSAFGFLAASKGKLKVAIVYNPPEINTYKDLYKIYDKLDQLNNDAYANDIGGLYGVKLVKESLDRGFKFWVRAIGQSHKVKFPVTEEDIDVQITGKYVIDRGGKMDQDSLTRYNFESISSEEEWFKFRNSGTGLQSYELRLNLFIQRVNGTYPRYHMIFMLRDYTVDTAGVISYGLKFEKNPDDEWSERKSEIKGDNVFVMADIMYVNMRHAWHTTAIIAHEIGHMAHIPHRDIKGTVMEDGFAEEPVVTALDRAIAYDTWDIVSSEAQNYGKDVPYVIFPYHKGFWSPFGTPTNEEEPCGGGCETELCYNNEKYETNTAECLLSLKEVQWADKQKTDRKTIHFLKECWSIFGFLAVSKGKLKVAIVYNPPEIRTDDDLKKTYVKINEFSNDEYLDPGNRDTKQKYGVRLAKESLDRGFKFWVRAITGGPLHKVKFPVTEEDVDVEITGKYVIDRRIMPMDGAKLKESDFEPIRSGDEWSKFRNSGTALQSYVDNDNGKYPRYHMVVVLMDNTAKTNVAGYVQSYGTNFPPNYVIDPASRSKRKGPDTGDSLVVFDIMYLNMRHKWHQTVIIAHELGHMVHIPHPQVKELDNWGEQVGDEDFDTMLDYIFKENELLDDPEPSALDRALAYDIWDIISTKEKNYTNDVPFLIKDKLRGTWSPFDNSNADIPTK